MSDDSSKQEPKKRPGRSAGAKGATAVLPTIRERLVGLGLVPSGEIARSLQLYHQSVELHGLARQVGVFTRLAEDGAPLLRKSVYKLFAAVLRLDGTRVSSYDRCRAQIEEVPEHRELFADLLPDLPLLEELAQSLDRMTGDDDSKLKRYDALLRRMPANQKKVHRYLIGRMRKAGGRPYLAKGLIGGALLALATVVFVVVWTQLGSSGEPALSPDSPDQASPAGTVGESGEARGTPRRCFRGTYYRDTKFERPVGVRRDCAIAFDWGLESPTGMEGLPPDGFSVRWEGILRPPRSGEYTFHLRSDDGSRLYLQDELIVDNWGGHALEEKKSKPIRLGSDQGYRLRVDYFDDTGTAQVELLWSTAGGRPDTVLGQYVSEAGAAGQLEAAPSASRASGADAMFACLRGSYFAGTAFEKLVGSRRDCAIAFDWGMQAPDGIEGLPEDGFSVRWEGTLSVPETSEYVFYLGSDDGSRMYLSEELIVDNWSDHAFVDKSSKPIRLETGASYPLRVEFYDSVGVAAVSLFWSSESIEQTPVPGKHLRSGPLATPGDRQERKDGEQPSDGEEQGD
jgi:hypothetical protein